MAAQMVRAGSHLLLEIRLQDGRVELRGDAVGSHFPRRRALQRHEGRRDHLADRGWPETGTARQMPQLGLQRFAQVLDLRR